MVKKAIIGTAVVVLLGVLLFGTNAVSYVRASAGRVSEAVHDSVPMDLKIDVAREAIDALVPEIRTNLQVIAKEQVELEALADEIAKAEAKLDKGEQEMARLSDDLKADKEVFVYAGRNYSVDQVKTDLARRLERCKTAKATLETKEQMYQARLAKLDATRQKLDGMLSEKRRLQVEIEHVEARLEMLAAAQTTSEYSFDDTRLSRAKELVNDLRTRLDVAEKLVTAESELQGEILLEEPAPEDVVEQVAEYFGEQEPAVEALAQD
jgi:chromosome segregation ATPase